MTDAGPFFFFSPLLYRNWIRLNRRRRRRRRPQTPPSNAARHPSTRTTKPSRTTSSTRRPLCTRSRKSARAVQPTKPGPSFFLSFSLSLKYRKNKKVNPPPPTCTKRERHRKTISSFRGSVRHRSAERGRRTFNLRPPSISRLVSSFPCWLIALTRVPTSCRILS